MFNRQASSNCFHTSFSATCKQTTEELPKHREEMMSEFYHHHKKQQLLQINSSLMRYHSVPDSLLAISVRGVEQGSEDFFPQSSSPDPESIFSRFKTCSDGDLACPDLHTIEEKPSAVAESVPEKKGFSSAPLTFYQADSLPTHVSAAVDESPFRALNSMAVDSQLARNSSNGSNLMRHSSSPAGLFSPLTAENVLAGYAVMRDVGNFRAGNVSDGVATASTSRLKNQVSFSPRQASAPELLFQISEMESESMGTSNSDDGSLGNGNGIGRCYVTEFPMSSWEESPLENFSCLRRVRDINGKTSGLISSENQQKGDPGNFASGLNHWFSLPKTKSELAAMEKFGQFQDSVPCKIRAKRGCATHPRSIAERVRRTRISERMRKLQELVPNMDKQTNTADMLDLAVEYIKDLQKQVKTLTDDRDKCSCLSNQNQKPRLTSAT